MAQSLHAIKRFRLRELQIVPPRTTRIAPALSLDTSQRPPLARTPSLVESASTSTLSVTNPFVPHKNSQSGRWAPPKYSLRRQAELIKHARASGTLHLLPPGPKMGQAQQQQQQLLTAVKTTTPALVEEAVVVGSGLVSLRSRQEAEEKEKEETAEERETEGQVHGAVDARASDVADAAWTRPVEWVGAVRERNVAGADVGNRLYAGKKRMFKGHKWERTRERRVARTNMLLRDMDKRVERFKGVSFFLRLV
jgi:large subunit ribosomal protein L25